MFKKFKDLAVEGSDRETAVREEAAIHSSKQHRPPAFRAVQSGMTETPKRPLVTRTGLITAAIALSFPVIADRLIVAAMSEAKAVGVGVVIGMAIYTAAPFLLLDSAMRPRRRVRVALWLGLALTLLIWAGFAQTGRAAQVDPAAGNAHVGLYMLTMIWPAAVIVLMGLAAKVGETEHDA